MAVTRQDFESFFSEEFYMTNRDDPYTVIAQLMSKCMRSKRMW